MASASSVPDQTSTAQGLADQTSIDLLMRRFFEQSRSGPAELQDVVQPEGSALASRPPRDFEMSTELLDRAAKAFDLLISRCQVLEEALDGETERAKNHAAGQADTIEQWKRLASGLQAQIEASERSAMVLKQRCETSEAKADTAEQRVTALERSSADAASHAVLAEQMSTRLHDKVLVAFGVGSRAHPVLEAVTAQVAAE